MAFIRSVAKYLKLLFMNPTLLGLLHYKGKYKAIALMLDDEQAALLRQTTGGILAVNK